MSSSKKRRLDEILENCDWFNEIFLNSGILSSIVIYFQIEEIVSNLYFLNSKIRYLITSNAKTIILCINYDFGSIEELIKSKLDSLELIKLTYKIRKLT